MDFRLGGVGRDEDEQAAMLDDMLAEAEAEDDLARESPYASQSNGGSTGRGGRVMDMKPSELAAKYGVDAGR